jgi:hypothetical protein
VPEQEGTCGAARSPPGWPAAPPAGGGGPNPLPALAALLPRLAARRPPAAAPLATSAAVALAVWYSAASTAINGPSASAAPTRAVAPSTHWDRARQAIARAAELAT